MHNKNILTKFTALLAAAILLFTVIYAEENIVKDFAGTGEMGYKDDASPLSTFTLPYSLALDKDNSIIVVDSYSNRIRRISDSKVTTIAGSSESKDLYGMPLGGYKDGEAAEARFNKPRAAVVDSKGAIYVSDTGNNVIRRIADGKVYTFCGTGIPGYKNGSASEAQFNSPSGLAIDSEDNIYVADTLNNIIRKITPAGDVSTYAGVKVSDGKLINGSLSDAYFNEPSDIVVAKDKTLYVLDSGNQSIRKLADNTVSTLCGLAEDKLIGTSYYKGGFTDGALEEAQFNFPKGMYMTDNGLILVADTYNHSIRAVNPNGQVITIAGNGKAGRLNSSPLESMFNAPTSVLYTDGKVLVADMYNNVIREFPISLDKLMQATNPLYGISFDEKTEQVQIWLEKQKIEFADISPYINDEGKTMIPLDYMCELLGAEITKADLSTNTFEITMDNKVYKLSPENGAIESSSQAVMVHIRALSDSLGFKVFWVDEYRAVVISTQKGDEK